RNPRSLFRWPPDWRRRLLVAAIAAPIVFAVTFQAARRSQNSAICYMSGGMVNHFILEMQKQVDYYTVDNGHPPASLTDVPEIAQRVATDRFYLTDPWQHPFLLKTINGKPTVISYGADGAPGGK